MPFTGSPFGSSGAGGGGGETNTASNAGTGVSIFYQKSVADLEFYGLSSNDNKLSIAIDGGYKLATFLKIKDIASCIYRVKLLSLYLHPENKEEENKLLNIVSK